MTRGTGAHHRAEGMRQHGREVVVVEAVRTAIGRGHREKGAFRERHPRGPARDGPPRAGRAVGAAPARVENVIAGCVHQFGEQGLNVARTAWLQEGLPITTSAQTIDLQCGSAQQAVGFAASQIAAGGPRRRDRLRG